MHLRPFQISFRGYPCRLALLRQRYTKTQFDEAYGGTQDNRPAWEAAAANPVDAQTQPVTVVEEVRAAEAPARPGGSYTPSLRYASLHRSAPRQLHAAGYSRKWSPSFVRVEAGPLPNITAVPTGACEMRAQACSTVKHLLVL